MRYVVVQINSGLMGPVSTSQVDTQAGTTPGGIPFGVALSQCDSIALARDFANMLNGD